MRYQFRPLVWTGPVTPAAQRRSRGTFKAGFRDTLGLLERELTHLHAKDVIIEADFTPSDIRLDGMPRANAKQPLFPGVAVSFTSQGTPMRYRTDTCVAWQHNLRCIALGLEALRAVDRYGITESGEQYVGWTQIGAAPEVVPEAPEMSQFDAVEFLCGVAGVRNQGLPETFRRAKRVSHPDAGGSAEQFIKVMAAGRLLGLL